MEDFDYSFSENGLVAYHNGVLIGRTVRGLSSLRALSSETRPSASRHSSLVSFRDLH